jgi:hypothetical protein
MRYEVLDFWEWGIGKTVRCTSPENCSYLRSQARLPSRKLDRNVTVRAGSDKLLCRKSGLSSYSSNPCIKNANFSPAKLPDCTHYE